MEICVTISRRGRWLGGKRSRSFTFDLPGSWKDLSFGLALEVVGFLSSGNVYGARMAIIRDTIKEAVRPKLWRYVNELDLSDAYNALSWVELNAAGPEALISYFDHKGERFYFLAPGFENGTALDFVTASRYYDEYIDGAEGVLVKLTAVLARRMVFDKDLKVERMEVFEDVDQLPAWADRLAGLSNEAALVALVYFFNVKKHIRELYGADLFQPELSDEGDRDPGADARASSGVLFGWYGVFLNVAKVGVFGNFREVLLTPFHDVAAFLVKEAREAREREIKMKNKKAFAL